MLFANAVVPSQVFVCAWNPVNPSTLASGYVFFPAIKTDTNGSFRSKDSIVHIWNVPAFDQDGTPATIENPLTCAYVTKSSEADLTSIAWSNDGAFVAVGCYDSVLRICDAKGRGYFTHTQHDVSTY